MGCSGAKLFKFFLCSGAKVEEKGSPNPQDIMDYCVFTEIHPELNWCSKEKHRQ